MTVVIHNILKVVLASFALASLLVPVNLEYEWMAYTAHTLVFVLVAVIVGIFTSKFKFCGIAWVLGITIFSISVVLGVLTELAQNWIPKHGMEPADVGFNTIGSAIGVLFFVIWKWVEGLGADAK